MKEGLFVSGQIQPHATVADRQIIFARFNADLEVEYQCSVSHGRLRVPDTDTEIMVRLDQVPAYFNTLPTKTLAMFELASNNITVSSATAAKAGIRAKENASQLNTRLQEYHTLST